MTTTYTQQYLGGDIAEDAGIYGVYFAGNYTGDMRVLAQGETFPPAMPGLAYRLHERF